MICRVLAMEILQEIWKQHIRPRAVVGYGVKMLLPSPPNYITRSPWKDITIWQLTELPKSFSMKM